MLRLGRLTLELRLSIIYVDYYLYFSEFAFGVVDKHFQTNQPIKKFQRYKMQFNCVFYELIILINTGFLSMLWEEREKKKFGFVFKRQCLI